MRYCTQCGHQLGEGHRFCRACGHDMQITNPSPPADSAEVVDRAGEADEAKAETIHSAAAAPGETAADRERDRAAKRAEADAHPAPETAPSPDAETASDLSGSDTADPPPPPAGRRVAKIVRSDDDEPLPDSLTVTTPTPPESEPPAPSDTESSESASVSTARGVPQLQIARMPLCPYCLDHLSQQVLACRSCSTEYHEQCWSAFRGCVHAGCDEWRLRTPTS